MKETFLAVVLFLHGAAPQPRALTPSAQDGRVKVSGRVSGLSLPLKPGITISMVNSNTRDSVIAPVQLDGAFEFPGILPGSYRVTISPRPDQFERWVIVGSTDLTNIDIPLPIQSFKIAGVALGEAQLRQNGKVGKDEIIVMILMDPARQLQTENQSPIMKIGYMGAKMAGSPPSRPASDGTFQFSNIPAGTYRIYFGKKCADPTCDVLTFDIQSQSGTATIVTVTDKDVLNLIVPINF